MNRLLPAILLALTPVMAHGATYYVAKTGSDSNTCAGAQSASTPKLTIKAGLACLSGGDTLTIKTGTYEESIGGDNGTAIPSGIDANNRTLVEGETAATVIVKPASGNFVAWIHSRNYIILKNLTFDAANTASTVVNLNGTVSYIRVERCVVKNGPLYGISVPDQTEEAHNFEIINNDIGPTSKTSLYFKAHTGIIEGNSCHDVQTPAANAIRIAKGVSDIPPNNWVIRNNRIYNNPKGINLAGGDGNLVYNNLVYNNNKGDDSSAPFTITGNVGMGSAHKIYNNTIFNNKGYCVWILAGTGHFVRNNICWGNTNNSIRNDTTGNTISYNLFTDPSFVDAAAGNFGLSADSIAINAGITTSEVTRDFLGSLRPKGANCDIGALQYTGTPPTNLRVISQAK